ncbi:MDR family MFS transporter [Limosilactobacillus fermentum]|uniref:MDR family MFS transporter n=1 Tax=Limosilactobacillus fermentum TaxID=1613 RepID=UPI001C00526A|nr:MDR family MFS transporter [Limosilactobacillus fermentum]
MDINGKPYNRAILVAVLTVGSFFTMLTGTFLATAYPAIIRSFDISTSTVQWLTTSFMLVTGIMIPISAWLINKLNSRVMYISAMATFLIGTIIAFTAPNFGLLLTGRVIQSIGVGVSMPLNQTVMLSIFPPEKRGAAMGVVGVAMGLAPAVGPTMSGLIVDNWSWRDLFGIMIPAIVIVIALALVYMKPVLKVHQQPMDLWSIITSTVGFGGLLYGVSEASNRGWGDALVLSCIVIGIIFIVLFAHRQLHLDAPFLDLTVFKYGEFTLAAVLSSAVNLAMVGVEMLLPLYIQNIRGESAFHSGLMLLPGALMLGLMSPVTGRLFDRYGARFLLITGLTLLIIGTVPFLTLTKNTPVISIVVFYAIRLFGVSMVFMPVTTSGMNVLPITEMAHGTAVNNTFRQTMSSIGTAIMTTVLTNVTNMQKPTHALLEKAPLSYKDHYIKATLAGFHAAFLVAALFAVISLILAFFLKNGNRAREIALQQQKGE